MVKWTEDQKKAIEVRDRNILVSAAAGSGKTAVLVERIINIIIKDKVSLENMLIVTFTNAAASEMRERILNSLVKKIEIEKEDSSFIREQIGLVNKALITTMHSFCLDIVKKNYYKIDIDPNFKIGDTTELQIMLSESIDQVFENEYMNEKSDFISLVEAYGTNRDDKALKEIIIKLYYFIQSKPNPLGWLKDAIELYSIEKEEFDSHIWVKSVKENIKYSLESLKSILHEAIETASEEDGPSEYLDALLSDYESLEDLEESLEENYDDFTNIIKKIEFLRMKSVSKKRKEEVDLLKIEKTKKLRDDYKKIIRKLSKSLGEKNTKEIIKVMNEMYPYVKYIYKLVSLVYEKYLELKKEKSFLDFNDLEQFSIELLKYEDIRKYYQEKFDYIVLDEYQDSNIVQETIINSIKRDNNLFLVGDVKQSIYRFRLADPDLFIEKYKNYNLDEGKNDVKIDLSMNFRSRKEILNAINFIFDNIMLEEIGNIDYDENAFLYNGMDFKENYNSSVDVDIIEGNTDDIVEGENNNEVNSLLLDMQKTEIEALHIAKKIKSILGEKIYIAKKNEYKAIEYRDIVILLRATKSRASVFAEIFANEGIPLFSDVGNKYFEVLEIKIFINLLRLIDNRFQDIPLITVLRSSIGNFSIEELISIREFNLDERFFNNFYNYNKDDLLRKKIIEFTKKIDNWSFEASYMKLDEFLWKVLKDSGFYNFVGASIDGENRQGNLKLLIEKADYFEKSTSSGIFSFIKYIEKLEKSSGDMGSAVSISENDNVARLMSIHKSKGLEFPVVILSGSGNKFNLMDLSGNILIDKDLGFGLKYINYKERYYKESLPQNAIKHRLKKATIAEELRILYVALTRAVDKLIIVGYVKKLDSSVQKWKKTISPFLILESNSYLDLIMTVLIKHKDAYILREGLEDYELIENESKWNINIYPKYDIVKNIVKKEEIDSSLKSKLINCDFTLDENNLKFVDEKFNFKYKYEQNVMLPSKLVATDMKKIENMDYKDLNYKIPSLISSPKFMTTEKIDGALIGTTYHKIFQNIDFKNGLKSKDYIINLIDKLVSKNLIDKELVSYIKINKILKFLESDLYNRIAESEKYFKEEPFVFSKNINGEKVLVQGIIDLFYIENNEIVLVDYKSDKITSNISTFVNKYKGQLSIYKEALLKSTDMIVKDTYIYFIDKSELVKVEV